MRSICVLSRVQRNAFQFIYSGFFVNTVNRRRYNKHPHIKFASIKHYICMYVWVYVQEHFSPNDVALVVAVVVVGVVVWHILSTNH